MHGFLLNKIKTKLKTKETYWKPMEKSKIYIIFRKIYQNLTFLTRLYFLILKFIIFILKLLKILVKIFSRKKKEKTR